jgi:hypothetical protein
LGTASALFFSVIQEPLPSKLPPFQVPSNEQNPELNVDNVDTVNTHQKKVPLAAQLIRESNQESDGSGVAV